MLRDGRRVGEMHTAAAGAAELGEELGHAHVRDSRASGACPWIVRGSDGAGSGQVRGR